MDNPSLSKLDKFVIFLFLSLNIFLLAVSILSLFDNVFIVCKWSSGMFTPEVQCPLFFKGYEILVDLYNFIGIMFIYLWVIFIPVGVVLFFLARKCIVHINTIINNNETTLSLNKLNLFKLAIIASPVILFISFFCILVIGGQNSFRQQSIIYSRIQHEINDKRAIENKAKENHYLEISKNNPDFCPDAPDSIFLNRTYTAGNPLLEFPKEYWGGKGFAYLSRENYWNGASPDINNILRMNIMNMYNPNTVIDFLTESNMYFNGGPYPADFPLDKGQRYDLRVFTFIDSSKDIATYENMRRSGISNSELKEEKCLTVTVKN